MFDQIKNLIKLIKNKKNQTQKKINYSFAASLILKPAPVVASRNYNPKTTRQSRNLIFTSSKVMVLLAVVLFSGMLSRTVGLERLFWAQASSSLVEAWWPTEGAVVSDQQPIKAMLQNAQVENYNMFWSVDNGSWNWMGSNYEAYPHKETVINYDGWNWRGEGPYTIKLTAVDFSGKILGEKQINIYTGTKKEENVKSRPDISQAKMETPFLKTQGVEEAEKVKLPSPQVNARGVEPNSSLGGSSLYVNPNNSAKLKADSIRSYNSYESALLDKIGNSSQGIWLGNWNNNVKDDVSYIMSQAKTQNSVPVFVFYNIPNRDCGNHSAGGSGNKEDYMSWVNKVAEGIGSGKAMVVLEPDGITLTDCLSQYSKQERFSMLKEAVSKLKSLGNTVVYIDAGHSAWLSVEQVAEKLSQAGVAMADGFALNTSNFRSQNESLEYGQKISQKIGGKHFVVDTSRNGNGPDGGNWCNPRGRALGSRPTTNTGIKNVDAFLWIKAPGESDGSCNGGPGAGMFWTDYALELAKNSIW